MSSKSGSLYEEEIFEELYIAVYYVRFNLYMLSLLNVFESFVELVREPILRQ